MSVFLRATRVALNTSTGVQSITMAGMGTPKAALFIVSRAVTDAVAADHAALSVGWTDGVRDRCVHTASTHGAGTTAARRGVSITSLLALSDGAGTLLAEAVFSAWVTDGVQINITTAPGAAYLCTVLFLGGDELQVYAGHLTSNASIGGTTAVTAPGFTPHSVFLASARTTSANVATGGIAVGIADKVASTITQRSVACGVVDAAGTSAVSTWFSVVDAAKCVSETQGRIGGDITSMDALGFTMTTRDVGEADYFIYLAANWGTRQHALATINPPTVTGSQAYTWPGFTPQCLVHGLSHVQALDTLTTDGTAGAFGLSVREIVNGYCTAIADKDNVATTDTQSLSDDQTINVPQHDGTAGQVAAVTSLDALGYTMNHTAVLSGTREWWAFAVEEDTGNVARRRLGMVHGVREYGVAGVRVA